MHKGERPHLLYFNHCVVPSQMGREPWSTILLPFPLLLPSVLSCTLCVCSAAGFLLYPIIQTELFKWEPGVRGHSTKAAL